MRGLAKQTSGVMILSDGFSHSQFRDSFRKRFLKDLNGHLDISFNAGLEVRT